MALRRVLLVGMFTLMVGLAGVGSADADEPTAIAATSHVEAEQPSALDDDLGDESESDGGIAPLLGGLVILGAVLGIGLAAIKRQRAEGRRSKLPPIG